MGTSTDPVYSDGIIRDAVMVLALKQPKHVTVAYLQRRVRVGFGRACRLADELEAAGYVGPPFEHARAVLMTRDELWAAHEKLRSAPAAESERSRT